MSTTPEERERHVGKARRDHYFMVALFAFLFLSNGGWYWLLASLILGNAVSSDEWDLA